MVGIGTAAGGFTVPVGPAHATRTAANNMRTLRMVANFFMDFNLAFEKLQLKRP
jgi:hypothetical protein